MRPWIVWGTGLLSYLVAVLDRTTFGVSGLDAAERFHAGPSTLSSFVIVQLIIYAAMQIPAGVLLDRFGPRAMITTGVAVLSAAQATLALTESLPVAVGAYGVIGLGDSFIFISVIRLLPNWFAPERVPLLTQLTGICGQFGQFLSAVPFLAILLHGGWTAAYLSAAGLGLFAGVLTIIVARDAPAGAPTAAHARTFREAFGEIKMVWSRPGTKAGFFTHMGNAFSPGVFALMWGVPYLTTAQGLSRGMAGAALTLSVAPFIVVGLLVGTLSARWPQHRSKVALTMMALIVVTWTVLLALPNPAPHWLLVVLILVISAGQPVSMLAFDFARTYNPPAALGTAQGMVNTGGFIATLLVMQAMGVVIAMTGGYSFSAFRLAWTLQYVVWAVAAIGVISYARKARESEALGETPLLVAAGER
ncbi:MFS transporter [Mycolicibacter arupensis]|uniref:MFS transporter n=1 Tax=Mycolicibacter arupensis TaxID=342002 RepID=A0A0F5MWV4_9MYCO|nr:MFS transporter [Mycolicibacter arupensis]KKB98532.1 MFS transporter [Mycolicibacter arupensis]MCV7277691.1 MFS transporter [Mycolicibacter arupensis]OQZ95416.1 MFS transporter [Mycolicibacter arupensis]